MATAKSFAVSVEKYPYPTHFGSHASMIFNAEGLDKLRIELSKKADAPPKSKKKDDKKPAKVEVTEGVMSLKAKVVLAEKHLAEVTPDKVVLLDEHGTYITERKLLDNGTADPNRYAQSRVEYMCSSILPAKKDEAKAND